VIQNILNSYFKLTAKKNKKISTTNIFKIFQIF